MFRSEEQRPMNAQFAVRIAILSGIALVLFAAIFFRLWYLGVLSGEEYLAQSKDNQVRTIPIPAPRGEILDAEGRVLVSNQTSVSLQVRPDQLPARKSEADAVLRELGKVANLPFKKIKQEIRDQTRALPANPVTLKSGVDPKLVYALAERKSQFPGVTAGEVSVRRYPREDLAAHLMGFVSEVSAELLKEPQYQDLDPGDRIGREGLEQQYDEVLRGRDGSVRVQVDAFGNPQEDELTEVAPVPGNNLQLSIDTKVQKAGEEAIAGIGLPGAFVAMDADTGAIVAMGSYPTFNPGVFTPPVNTDAIDTLSEDPDVPLFNRATAGLYPTGSTYKPITALAAIGEGVLGVDEVINDGGSYSLGDGNEVTNSCDCAGGALTVQTALQISSNVYFAIVGSRLETETDDGLQKWSQDLGMGSPTGIDLPGEAAGLLPTPEWRNELYRNDETDRPWSVGDNINLALGQGDLQADPLQMAVAYAAIANGGSIVRPHLAAKVVDGEGATVTEFAPAPRRQIDIPPEGQAAILAGMRDAAMTPTGTSYEVFGGFPIDIAGKTGTAERPPNPTQSWFASVGEYPITDESIVVVATIEAGGYGAEAAAPVAKAIYSAYYGVDDEASTEESEAATATTAPAETAETAVPAG
jgi:penicillin-binding protein 2